MHTQSPAGHPLAPFSIPVPAAALLTLWLTILLVWAGEPQWDLAIQRAFFDAALCEATATGHGRCVGFPAAAHPVLMPIRNLLHNVPTYLGMGLLVWFLIDWHAGYRLDYPPMRTRLAVLATAVVWPILIVNGVLKAFWGRPRPRQVEEFGGSLPFVEAGTISDYCASNCSFVSGEGASAGWLVCLIPLFVPRWRKWAAAILIPIGVFMASLRVAFGAHFASDALLSFLGAIVTFAIIATILEMRFGPKSAQA